jgi:hypothetical protein
MTTITPADIDLSLVTNEMRANLAKLANYLDTLPDDYPHFEMATYLYHQGPHSYNPERALAEGKDDVYLNDCGTVACMVGHGPAAGIPIDRERDIYEEHEWNEKETELVFVKRVNWDSYVERELIAGTDEVNWSLFSFLFGGIWTHRDNTPRGGAARIRYALAGETIPAYGDDYRPSLYASYRREA